MSSICIAPCFFVKRGGVFLRSCVHRSSKTFIIDFGSDATHKPLSVVSVMLIVCCFILPADAQEGAGRPYYDFGVFAYESGDYEEAEANFLKAIEFSQDDAFTPINWARRI